MVCRGMVCDACLEICERDHQKQEGGFSPVVVRFFKVIFDKDYSKFMYLPPVIARTVKHLTNKETQLEDSSGRQWPVTLSCVNGSLAFHKGWQKFFQDHSLKRGQLLTFNYIEGSHFIVQIFGLNTREITCVNVNDEMPPRSKRARRDQQTAPEYVYLDGKPTSATSSGAAYERCSSKTNSWEEQNAHFGVSECLPKPVNKKIEDSICMMNRDDTCSGQDRNLLYDLSCFEQRTVASGAKNTSQKASITTLDPHHTENAKQNFNLANASDVKISLSGIRQPVDDDAVEHTEGPVDVAEKTVIKTDLFTRNFGDVINMLAEKKPVVKSKFGEFPFSSSLGKKPPVVPNHAQKIFPPVKVEVVQDETGPYTTDYVPLCSFSAELKSRLYLELPKRIGTARGGKSRVEGMVLFLKDSKERMWPVVYREYYGGRALTGNWSKFCEQNDVKVGDTCRFVVVDVASRIYRVDVARKS